MAASSVRRGRPGSSVDEPVHRVVRGDHERAGRIERDAYQPLAGCDEHGRTAGVLQPVDAARPRQRLDHVERACGIERDVTIVT